MCSLYVLSWEEYWFKNFPLLTCISFIDVFSSFSLSLLSHSFCSLQAVGTLKVSGYIRGRPLSVNSLVHIPGLGDYQMAQVQLPLCVCVWAPLCVLEHSLPAANIHEKCTITSSPHYNLHLSHQLVTDL